MYWSIHGIDPQPQPPEIIEGRQEIWDCWMEAFSNPQNVDTLAFSDSLTGGLQYAWNNCGTSLSRAYGPSGTYFDH